MFIFMSPVFVIQRT